MSTTSTYDSSQYYSSQDITSSSLPTYLPSNTTYYNRLNSYNSLQEYFISNQYSIQPSYKYLSNFYDVSYAIDSVYAALSTSPYAQAQANNTGEDYFNTAELSLSNFSNMYIYVIGLNQNKMTVGLISNIQIYNTSNNGVIENGTIYTSPGIPSFVNKNYPLTDAYTDNIPLIIITEYSIANMIENSIASTIVAVERIGYDFTSYNHPTDSYQGKCVVFIGNQLSPNQINTLETEYDLAFNTVTY